MSELSLYEKMGAPHLFDPTLPQTAQSEGGGPSLPWCDLESIHDLASLDLACQRYLRRKAFDAVDHLIAVLDALDVAGVDDEDGADDEDTDEDGADDDAGEPSLGAPERHPWVFSMTAAGHEPAAGGRLHRSTTREFSQVGWAAGSRLCGEGEGEAGYDLPEGDDERCASDDVDAEATSLELHGRGLVRVGDDDAEDDDPAESVGDAEPYLSVVEWTVGAITGIGPVSRPAATEQTSRT